ncbi:MAG: hypothetical protein WC716_11750 [Chitinophagaceae bacterium]|jgi:hypothetical protein
METVLQYRKLLRRTRPDARCGKSKRTTEPFSAPAVASHDFLKHSFLPKWEEAKEPIKTGRETETEFYASLSVMAEKHGLTLMDVSGRPYPYNLLLSHWDAQRKLQKHNKDAELLLSQNENGKVVLCNNEAYMTGSTLYYIPVEPLFMLIRNRAKKKSAELLLSVCSYLCRIAGVPYFRENTYLGWQYEMIGEWVIEGAMDFENEKDYRMQVSAIKKANYIGDVMGRRLYSSYHLQQLENRIHSFQADDHFDKECLRLAKLTLSLTKDYPNNNIFSHLTEPDNCDEVVMADQYISFVCEIQGNLFEEIKQMVNEDFGNKGDMQQPLSYCYYDDSCNMDTVSYEQKLFPMMEDLITLLCEK